MIFSVFAVGRMIPILVFSFCLLVYFVFGISLIFGADTAEVSQSTVLNHDLVTADEGAPLAVSEKAAEQESSSFASWTVAKLKDCVVEEESV